MFLSQLKLEDTDGRLPRRHLALSLCAEDVKAQRETLTPETGKRLQSITSQQEVDHGTEVSSAHAHGNLNIRRNPPLRVYRVPMRDEEGPRANFEAESGLSEQPHSQSDPETEYDSHTDVPDTRKRRRLRHKTPVCPRVFDGRF